MKKYYYKGKDIYNADTGQHILPTEWQKDWVGVKDKQLVDAPIETPTNINGTGWNIPTGYKHIPDVDSLVNYEKGTTQQRPGTNEIWGKPIVPTTQPQPQPQTGTTPSQLQPAPTTPTPITPKNDWTTDEVKNEYKQAFGQSYEPVGDQTWDTVRDFHNTHGTPLQQLKDWATSPEAQAQVDKEKVLITQIKNLSGKNEEQLKKDLLDAGVSVKDSADILASVEGVLPEWSKRAAGIENDPQYKKKKDEAEKNITKIEGKMLDFFEKNESSIADFNEFAKDYKIDDIKNQVDDKDAEINRVNDQLNSELLDASKKVIPQWMISGEKKLSIQRATNNLTRLEAERTSLAKRYNRAIDEITYKVGLKNTDTVNEAKNLQTQLNIYSGQETRVNQKIIEALNRGKTTFTEDKQKILNDIKAGLVPTKASIVKKVLEAKMRGVSGFKTFGNDLYYYDAIKNTFEKKASGEEKNKLSQTKLNQLAAIGVPNVDAIDFQKMLEDFPLDAVRKRIEEKGKGKEFDLYIQTLGPKNEKGALVNWADRNG